MTDFGTKRTGRLGRLLAAVGGARKVCVVTHDTPDPDAIASGWGLVELFTRLKKAGARIYAGGAITRAENRVLVELLKPPLELVDVFKPAAEAAVVVVDTLWPALLGEPDREPVAAVIDHHHHERLPDSSRPPRFRFRDIRPHVVATSSMVAGYLKAAGIVPGRELATALLYGIHTDAQGWDVKYSRVDRAAISWLAGLSDPQLRAQIERAPLPREYFEELILALQCTFTYEDAAVCFLPSAEGSELVGEVADLLLRCDGIDRVLCGAIVSGRLVLSARTSAHAPSAAGVLLARVVRGLGASGGHAHRAGGTIPLAGRTPQELEHEVRTRWLEACGIRKKRGVRLVPKGEILRALE